MRRALIVPIANVNGTVGTHRDIRRRKPGVLGCQQFAPMTCRHRRTMRMDRMPIDTVAQQITGDVLATIGGRHSVTLVDDAPHGHMAAATILMGRVFKISVSMRIMQSPMLAKRLDEESALNSVQQSVATVVGAIKQTSRSIETPHHCYAKGTDDKEIAELNATGFHN